MNIARHFDIPAEEERPLHQSGSYCAWSVGERGGGLADLAWHSRVDHAKPELHRLLPFIEPSISLQRRFDQTGETLSLELVVCPACPDGGAYEPEPGEEQFALRLVPELLDTVFGVAGAELISKEGRLPASLRMRLEPVMRLAERGDFVGAWWAMLRACAECAEEPRCDLDRATYAAQIVRAANGGLDPSELAQLAEISPRHLRRCFVERFGLSPKGVSRRLRLTAALLEAELHDKPQWAKIAAGYGFSDQAHMIRDCRAILGESPGELHRLRRPMAVSFNS